MEAFETQATFPGQHKNILEEMAESLSDIIKNLSDDEWQSPLRLFSIHWSDPCKTHIDHNI